MTDKQIVNIVLKRAAQSLKSNDYDIKNDIKIVMYQQYHKKLYFGMSNGILHPLSFSNGSTSMVFVLPELPERLMEWKTSTIKKMSSSKNCIEFDIETFPKEVVHMFASAIITALSSPSMSINMIIGGEVIPLFKSNETYETVQIEADLSEFNYS